MANGRNNQRGNNAPQQQQQQSSGRDPRYRIRYGAIKLSAWLNPGDNGNWFSIKLTRSYLKDNNWHDSDSFNLTDLPALIQLLTRAHHEMQMDTSGKEEFLDSGIPAQQNNQGGNNGGGHR